MRPTRGRLDEPHAGVYLMTLEALRQWLESLSEIEASIPAGRVLERLPEGGAEAVTQIAPPFAETWRERLWQCPAETRLGLSELVEAMGRSTSWAYRRTGPKAENPIPHRKLDGQLVFLAGEARHWIRTTEEPGVECPMESTPAERAMLQIIEGGQA